jgi:Domain of unknown function (DUF4333)
MSLLVRSGAVLALALVAFLALGCGGTVIDAAKTEDAIEHNLEQEVGQKVGSVDCPSDVEVTPGDTFECTVRLEDGSGETATLKILNSDADVEVANLQADKAGKQVDKSGK